MFKPGDKVQCISMENDSDDLSIGRTYIVDQPCDMARHSNGGWVCIKEDNAGKHNGFNLKYYQFELVEHRQPITNDIDWLDQIQLNFKV